MQRIRRLVLVVASIAAIGGSGIWLSQSNSARMAGDRREVRQRETTAIFGIKPLSRFKWTLGAAPSAVSPVPSPSSALLSASAGDMERLTEDQRGQVRPLLEALERMEEVAFADGDQELMEKISAEKQRLIRAVTGLDVQPVAVR